MGRHRRESPIGRLRLKFPKLGYDKHKLYTLYYEYTWLDNAVIRKDTQVRVRVDDWNEKGNMGKGELRSSFGSDYKRMNAMLNGQLLKYDATLLQYAQKRPHRMCMDVIHSILYDAPLTRQDEGKDYIEYVISCLDSKQTKNKIGKKLCAAEHTADENYLKDISSERPTQQALAREIYLRCEPLLQKHNGFLSAIR